MAWPRAARSRTAPSRTTVRSGSSGGDMILLASQIGTCLTWGWSYSRARDAIRQKTRNTRLSPGGRSKYHRGVASAAPTRHTDGVRRRWPSSKRSPRCRSIHGSRRSRPVNTGAGSRWRRASPSTSAGTRARWTSPSRRTTRSPGSRRSSPGNPAKSGSPSRRARPPRPTTPPRRPTRHSSSTRS